MRPEFDDKEIVCKVCGESFTWGSRSQVFFKEKGYAPPQKCKKCKSYDHELKSFDEIIEKWRAESLAALEEARKSIDRVAEILRRIP